MSNNYEALQTQLAFFIQQFSSVYKVIHME